MDAELSALVGNGGGEPAPCRGRGTGEICFVRNIAGVCKPRNNEQECWDGRADEVALAYAKSTGSGWGWHAAAAGALLGLVICLSLLCLRYHTDRRWARLRSSSFALALSLLGAATSLGGIATLAALHEPVLQPPSYATYLVPPDDVPVGDCPVEPGLPSINGYEWGLRFPSATSAFGRPALFVVARDMSSLPFPSVLVVVDADDLVPLWHLGPCPMAVELLPYRAVVSQSSGYVAALDGEATVRHAWWVRGGGSLHRGEDQSVSTLVPWGVGSQVVQVIFNANDGTSTEVVLPGFPDTGSAAARRQLESGLAGASDEPAVDIRFLAHNRLYELQLKPFQLRRIATDDLGLAATFPKEKAP